MDKVLLKQTATTAADLPADTSMALEVATSSPAEALKIVTSDGGQADDGGSVRRQPIPIEVVAECTLGLANRPSALLKFGVNRSGPRVDRILATVLVSDAAQQEEPVVANVEKPISSKLISRASRWQRVKVWIRPLRQLRILGNLASLLHNNEITPTCLNGVDKKPRTGPTAKALLTWSRKPGRFALTFRGQLLDPRGPTH